MSENDHRIAVTIDAPTDRALRVLAAQHATSVTVVTRALLAEALAATTGQRADELAQRVAAGARAESERRTRVGRAAMAVRHAKGRS